MANLVINVDELEKIVARTKENGDNTVVFTSTGLVRTNSSNCLKAMGPPIGNMSFVLITDPFENGYWKDVRNKFVLTKSNPNGSIANP